MKLLFCKKCNGVFNLQTEEKQCPCGETSGKYIDESKAEYSGESAVPFAIDNYSFTARIAADKFKAHNDVYDQMHGKGKIQCWLLTEGNLNADLITKVEKPKPAPEPRTKSLRACG